MSVNEMENKIERVRRKKKGFTKLPVLDNIYEPEIGPEPENPVEPEDLEEPEIVSMFIPGPESEPIIEGMSKKAKAKKKAAEAKAKSGSPPADSTLPDTNELTLGTKKAFDKFKAFVKNNGKYADIFYSIDVGLKAIEKQLEKAINSAAGIEERTSAFIEFSKEHAPILFTDIFIDETDTVIEDLWSNVDAELKKSYDNAANKRNEERDKMKKNAKNDANVISEVLRFYITTIIGILMSYNVLYTWMTPKGKTEDSALVGGGVAPPPAANAPEFSGGGGGFAAGVNPPTGPWLSSGSGGMPEGMPVDMSKLPVDIAGLGPGAPKIPGFGGAGIGADFSLITIFRWIYEIPWTAIKGLRFMFKKPGEFIVDKAPPTLVYFIMITFFTTFGIVNLAKKVSSGMVDSFISMSKGKFEKSFLIYIFIVLFWLIDVALTVKERPETYLNLIAGTILAITYLIIILVNALAFASIFNILISFYIMYRLILFIPIHRDFQTFTAFDEVNSAAKPNPDDETRETIDSHRHKPISLESFWKYVCTLTFLFENFFSFIFIIVTLVSTSILARNLKFNFLKSTLPLGMLVMLATFLNYKYTMLFNPECRD